MGSLVVVEVVPGLQLGVALVGAGPVLGVSPLLERGLDEAFGLSIAARGVGAGAAVLDLHFGTGLAELVGAVGAAVVGEQNADLHVALGEEAGRQLVWLQRYHLNRRPLQTHSPVPQC